MLLFTRKKEPPIDRRQSLAGVPVMNDQVTFETQTDGCLIVSVKLFRGKGLLAGFQPEVRTKRTKLDELGTFVLKQIDGRKNVLEIIEAFIGEFRTNRREAELSVAAFLKSLIARHVISITFK